MGKKGGLTKDGNSNIVEMLSNGETTNAIAKDLKRDHRTIKIFVQDSQRGRRRRTEKSFRKIYDRDVSRIKREFA